MAQQLATEGPLRDAQVVLLDDTAVQASETCELINDILALLRRKIVAFTQGCGIRAGRELLGFLQNRRQLLLL